MRAWIIPGLVALAAAVMAYLATPALVTRTIMATAIKRVGERAGFNRMYHAPLTTPETQTIVRPSPDLAYSSCPFDLTKGPVLITIAPPPGRYSSLSVFDANTDVAFVRNDLQAGGKPYQVLLVGPDSDFRTPPSAVILKYNRGIALLRILLADPQEMDQLEAGRRKSGCAPA